MTDTTDENDKPQRAPLTLKRPSTTNAGVVKQSFSHGRTKTVVVETKRRTPGAGPGAPVMAAPAPLVQHPRPNAVRPHATSAPVARQTGGDDIRLSDGEMQARQRALQAAQVAETERRHRAAAEAAERAQSEAAEQAKRASEPPVPEAPKAEAPAPAEAPPAAEAPRAPQQHQQAGPRSAGIQIGRFTNRPNPGAPQARDGQQGDRRPGQGEGQRSATPNSGRNEVYRAPTGADGRPERTENRGDRPGTPSRPGGSGRFDDGPRSAGIRLSRPPAGGAPRAPRPIGAGAAPTTPDVVKPGASRTPEYRRPGGADDKRKSDAEKAVSRTRGEPKRREGRLTITSATAAGDDGERSRSLASVRRAREKEKEKRARLLGGQDQGKVSRDIVIPEAITIQDLAGRMATRAVDVIKYLMKQGTMAKINDVIDADTAELIAVEFGHTVKRVAESDIEEGFIGIEDEGDNVVSRPPVVTIMGHVDHGKTSLLDALRHTDVVAGEAGGITQHIGAYQVRLKEGQRVTFLDTPGHAAFSAMRMRGAQVTDIVILVVAADDGVMPQTIEAISHAKAAGAPIIVAINKIDKSGANPQRVITDLLSHEIVTESMGGEVQAIEVSAKQKMGLEDLIDAILVQAEILDLKANPDRAAEGVVIESKIDKGRGPVATVLVKRGTLKKGALVVAGAQWGRVRALVDERAAQLVDAGPSLPVEILGLDGAPEPGEMFAVVENEARARELTEYRQRKKREKLTTPTVKASLEQMMAKLQTEEVKELPIVVKGDVQGSVEAIISSVEKLSTSEVKARVIHAAVGAVNESDVLLAKASNMPIVAFNVRPSKPARDLAEREGVEIRQYAVIYDLLDDIKAAMTGLLKPIIRENFLGNAEILEVFSVTKIGKVAGCRITEGKVSRGAKVRLLRDGVVIHEGTLSTLKRFKDEVSEVQTGQECGMSFANYQDIQKGDIIECFTVESVARTL
jgi:translation initiation factor IF-2